jgi:hypothetical protein
MSLTELKGVNSQLLTELPGTRFERRTITWESPITNLTKVVSLTSQLPIIATY